MPKISVIVPVYNVEKYLERCIDSILAQTFTDFELILVDDGSPDKCPDICDEYEKKDKRIHVIHQKNGGLSAARNSGIDWVLKYSRSEWITFIDSDDWICPVMLERMYNLVNEFNLEVAVCGFKVTSEEEQIELVGKEPFEVNFDEFYGRKYDWVNIITACGKIYKKCLFTEIRYPEGKLNEDIYTTYKVLEKTKGIVVLDEPLYYYYVREESIMNRKWTARRLDEINGYEEMIEFMSLKGYKQAKRKMIETYYWAIDRQIKMLKYSDGENNYQYRKYLIRKLKVALRKYKRIVSVSLKERYWLLENIYPWFFKLYWKIKSIKL